MVPVPARTLDVHARHQHMAKQSVGLDDCRCLDPQSLLESISPGGCGNLRVAAIDGRREPTLECDLAGGVAFRTRAHRERCSVRQDRRSRVSWKHSLATCSTMSSETLMKGPKRPPILVGKFTKSPGVRALLLSHQESGILLYVCFIRREGVQCPTKKTLRVIAVLRCPCQPVLPLSVWAAICRSLAANDGFPQPTWHLACS